MPTLKIVKTPSEALALTNCAIVNPADAKGDLVFIRRTFCLALKADGSVPAGSIGLSGCHRAWMQVSLNETLDVEVISQKQSHLPPIDSMMVEVRFLRKSIQNATPFDTEQMAEAMCRSFGGQPFALGQSLVMDFAGHTLSLLIKTVEPIGLLQAKSAIIKFYAAPDSAVKLVGPVKSTANPNALLQESFRFEDMGIGGLGEEFAMLFRRVFSSRLVPPTLARQFGLQHVKGVILFGPPGTGKTLIARQIGRMLNAREPKIVNGPEILNRFVGQSEENIRRLFEDAEREYAAKGDASQLHIIIFDELDAICRQRGGGRADTGVGDSIVNQLLAKMDGVEQLDNIVVVGMTNRKELIDEALLRPGRFEVHIAIGLPSEAGRLEILQIHTAAMQASGRLASDVDLAELAARARNFTGAELCGLIRAATSLAITRCIRVGTLAGLSDDIDSVQVCRADFVGAFEDVKAANGVSEGEFAACAPYGYIPFSPALTDLLSECAMTVRQVQSGKTSLCTLLLYGTASALQLFLFFLGAPGTGKTALAAKIASESDFQYAKLITSYSMLGMSEAARVAHIHKVERGDGCCFHCALIIFF